MTASTPFSGLKNASVSSVDTTPSAAPAAKPAAKPAFGSYDSILSVFQGEDVGLGLRSAALLAVQLLHESGEEAVAMTPKELKVFATAMRAKYPMAWGAVRRQDTKSFERFLRIGKHPDGFLDWKSYESGMNKVIATTERPHTAGLGVLNARA